MNYIYWFGAKFASANDYKDFCRRSGEPVVLRYCSITPGEYLCSMDSLARVLEETPERLAGVVVDGPLDLADQVVRTVAGRAPILFRKGPNPFRGVTPTESVVRSFRGGWLQCGNFELVSAPNCMVGVAAEFLWLSEQDMPAEQEAALRRQFGALTIRHCRPGDVQLMELLQQAEFVGTDLSASWMSVLLNRTRATCLYPAYDALGYFQTWKRVGSLRVETFSLPWMHDRTYAQKWSA